jgi:hypothetical protein
MLGYVVLEGESTRGRGYSPRVTSLRNIFYTLHDDGAIKDLEHDPE